MSDTVQKLIEALRAGSYSTAPEPLKSGTEFVIEDITPIIEKALDDVASGESLKRLKKQEKK